MLKKKMFLLPFFNIKMLLGSDKPALIAASTLISLAVAAVSVINDIFEKSLFLLPLYP